MMKECTYCESSFENEDLYKEHLREEHPYEYETFKKHFRRVGHES